MTNERILVVEDNLDNMTLIVDVLESMDYDVIQAEDGERGVLLAETQHPDLILMDLSLPKIDGWEATRMIKGNAALAQIPIVALTAHAMVGDRESALEAGCDDYMTKPLDLQILASKLSKFLSE